MAPCIPPSLTSTTSAPSAAINLRRSAETLLGMVQISR